MLGEDRARGAASSSIMSSPCRGPAPSFAAAAASPFVVASSPGGGVGGGGGGGGVGAAGRGDFASLFQQPRSPFSPVTNQLLPLHFGNGRRLDDMATQQSASESAAGQSFLGASKSPNSEKLDSGGAAGDLRAVENPVSFVAPTSEQGAAAELRLQVVSSSPLPSSDNMYSVQSLTATDTSSGGSTGTIAETVSVDSGPVTTSAGQATKRDSDVFAVPSLPLRDGGHSHHAHHHHHLNAFTIHQNRHSTTHKRMSSAFSEPDPHQLHPVVDSPFGRASSNDFSAKSNSPGETSPQPRQSPAAIHSSTTTFATPKPRLPKPNAMAFHSTGFLSKKSRPRSSSAQPTPETPSKKIFGGTGASGFIAMQSAPTPISSSSLHFLQPTNGVASATKPSSEYPPTPSWSGEQPPTPTRPPNSEITANFFSSVGASAPPSLKKHRFSFSESPVKNVRNKKPHLTEGSLFSTTEIPESLSSPAPSATQEPGALFAAGVDHSSRHGTRTRTVSSPASQMFLHPITTLQQAGTSAAFCSDKDMSKLSISMAQVDDDPFQNPNLQERTCEAQTSYFVGHTSGMPKPHQTSKTDQLSSSVPVQEDMMDCDEPVTPLTFAPPPPLFAASRIPKPSSSSYTIYPRFLKAEYFQNHRRLTSGNGIHCYNSGGASENSVSSLNWGSDASVSDSPQPDYFETNFRLINRLGRGSFADAFKVQSKTDGKLYAVKKSRHPTTGSKDRRAKLEEVEILWLVREGSQIVSIINAWEQFGFIYVQMELCEKGNLGTYLEENCKTSPLEELKIWNILCDMTQGVQHIHNLDVLHLDLKPGNIFITSGGALKIGDFGLATRYPVARGFEREGDRTYIAPEILESQYGKPCDIFSLGLIILEIMANIILPENGDHWHKLREHDFSECNFGTCSPPLIDLMKSMLHPSTTMRPSAGNIMTHPFVAALACDDGTSIF